MPSCKPYKEEEDLTKLTERPAILQEREKTHGRFAENAKISQELKSLFGDSKDNRSHTQNEALDMIALKLSRILSGQGSFKDHWKDIAGYAELGAEACE